MAIEDVGLRARIDGLNTYLAGARQIQSETNKIAQTVTATARTSEAESAKISAALATAGKAAAAAVAAFVAKKTVDAITSTISAASDLNETINKVDVVFGQSADTVKAWGDKSATALGLSKNQALSAAGTFGNLFTTIGLGQKQSAEFSTMLLQNAADLASFNNIDPTEVLDKLRSGLVGETEPLRALGIDVSDAALQVEALRQGITKSTQDMTQAEKVQLRYALVQRQMGNAEGDRARTAKGLANSQRTLQAEMANITAEIGQALLPVAESLTNMLADALPRAFEAVKPGLASITQGLRDIGIIAGNVWEQLAPVRQAFSDLTNVFSAFGAEAGPSVLSALGDIGTTVEAAFNQLLDIVAPLAEDIFNTAVGIWAQLAPEIQPALDNIVKVVGEVLQWIQQAWATFGGDVWRIVKEAYSGIADIIKGSLAVAGQVVGAFLDILQGDWSDAWDKISNIPAVALSYLEPAIKHILNALYTEMQIAVKALGLQDAWYNLRDFVIGVWVDVGNGIKRQLNNIIAGVNDFIDEVNKVASVFGQTIGRIQPIDMAEFIRLPRPDFFADEFSTLFEEGFGQVQPDEIMRAGGANKWTNAIRDWIGSLTSGVGVTAAPELGTSLPNIGRAGADMGPAVAGGARTAQEALRQLQDEAKDTENALKEAQAAMRAFSDPRLVGMQAAEDELFGLDQAIKKARLAELQMGDAVKDTNKETEDSFDMLGAQQRELAEGIPVAMQQYEDAQRKAQQAARTTAKAEPEGMTEVQRLEREREIKQLQMELNFDPQQRTLKELYETLTGANTEITFDQAKAGLEDSAAAATELQGSLEQQQAVIEAQQIILDAQKASTATIDATRMQTASTEATITQAYNDQTAAAGAQVGFWSILNGQMDEAKAKSAEVAANINSINWKWGDVAGTLGMGEGGQTTPGAGRGVTAMAEGGTVGRGGMALVGERGPELAVLPTGTTVLPNSALRPASVSRVSHADTWNINQASSPIRVADEVRRLQAWQRIRRGR